MTDNKELELAWAFVNNTNRSIFLTGKAGTGKTTFLHLIAGILSPDRGQIQINGKNVCQMTDSSRDLLRARLIGYVFQSFNLLQGFTCLENLQLTMSFADHSNQSDPYELLDRVGLGKRINYYPHQLSIGQQQRVALARALINKPKLVLADEPTGNLDPVNAAKSMELLCELCRESKTTLFLVSHDEKVIQNFEFDFLQPLPLHFLIIVALNWFRQNDVFQ